MSNSKNLNLIPPGPAESFDLNIHEDSFQKVNDYLKAYGDIVKVQPITRKNPTFLVNHPDLVKHILINNHRNYIKGIGFDRVKMLLGNGIIVSDGDFWRSQRRMIQPAFHRKVIARLSEMMQTINLQVLEKWRSYADQNQAINITEETSELALEIVLRSLFSDDLDQIRAQNQGNPFSILTDDSARDLQLVIKFRALRKMVLETVQARRNKDREYFDIIAMFMTATDQNDKAMSDEALLDEIMTMIVAGHETSAGTLNWAWYLLSQNPDAERQLQHEADAIEANCPGFDDLDNLSYARQILEETLRLYPPVWLFTRKALKDDHIGDYHIPAEADILISPYYLHRHAEFWDSAEEFRPQRFAAENINQQHKLAHIPFSAGPRRCIGDFFALVEMQIHLGLISKHFSLEYLEKQPIELDPNVNLRTRHSLFMVPRKR